ncbi:hypothetical protein ACWIUA_01420 [Ursidibacter sp. B-7004-1]
MQRPLSLTILSVALGILAILLCGIELFTLYARLSIKHIKALEGNELYVISNSFIDIMYISIIAIAGWAIFKGKFWGVVLFLSWAIPKSVSLVVKSIPFFQLEDYLAGFIYIGMAILLVISIFIPYKQNNRQFLNKETNSSSTLSSITNG